MSDLLSLLRKYAQASSYLHVALRRSAQKKISHLRSGALAADWDLSLLPLLERAEQLLPLEELSFKTIKAPRLRLG